MTRRRGLSRIHLWIMVALVASLSAGCSKVTESHRADQAIQIDGDQADWSGVPLYYLQESVRVFAIAHDDENLYAMCRFSDESLARRILLHGFTLWVNGDGKKKEGCGLRYGGSVALAEALRMEEEPREWRRPDGFGEQPPPLRALRVMPGTVIQVCGAERESFPESNPTGPAAASKLEDGVYFYELRIPLPLAGGKAASRTPGKGRRIALGLQVGGLGKAEREALQEQRPGRGGDRGGMAPGSGGMGGPGGGMPEGGGMGGRGGMGRGGMGPGPGHRPGLMGNSEVRWMLVCLGS
jgi:hypothetical protein